MKNIIKDRQALFEMLCGMLVGFTGVMIFLTLPALVAFTLFVLGSIGVLCVMCAYHACKLYLE